MWMIFRDFDAPEPWDESFEDARVVWDFGYEQNPA